jgi:Fic family protein
MDSHDFVDSDFGRPGKSPGLAQHAYTVYFPKPIPRAIDLSRSTAAALSDADRALGRLAGSGRLLKNPLLLANLYARREAVASTRIEGTQATLDDLYEAETGGPTSNDALEAINYVHALNEGLTLIHEAGITRDLVCRLHKTLLRGVRGKDKQPGVIRTGPNWIGSNDPATARFVPPPHQELEAGLADWESFAKESLEMPPLIQCALLHYQFETLHPFQDGNGRLGRLLIILYLVHEGHLPAPLLYLSTYFERHKVEYYDSLQGVRERGDIQAWLQYFARAVFVQAEDAVHRSERLVDLGEQYRARLSGSRSRAHELVDPLLTSPWVSTQRVRELLGITNAGAANLLKQLQGLRILEPTNRVPGRSNRWVAWEVMAALRDEDPTP